MMRPVTCSYAGRERKDAPTERDHQADCQLRDGLAIHSWRPPDCDAVSACGVEIDHVQPDAVLAHKPQLGHRLEHARVEHLEAGDGLLMPAQEVDQVAAGERAS